MRFLFDYIAELEPTCDSDSGPEDPEEARRERERQKLRELKKRKIRTSWGGLGLLPARQTAQLGVYIRRDLEDESQDVDVTMNDGIVGSDGGGGDRGEVVDEPSASTSIPSSSSTRVRKSSQKLQARNKVENPPVAPPIRKQSMKKSGSVDGGKPKPETYKQAWSMEEQHLLEQLLEQIPDGEKNR